MGRSQCVTLWMLQGGALAAQAQTWMRQLAILLLALCCWLSTVRALPPPFYKWQSSYYDSNPESVVRFRVKKWYNWNDTPMTEMTKKWYDWQDTNTMDRRRRSLLRPNVFRSLGHGDWKLIWL